jgi:catechol 2,3-dioxygenase-like lactoylglutathione lyase family enzyme
MFLLDHVSITVRDLNRVRAFYDAVMLTLGVTKVYDRPDAIGYGQRNRVGDDTHSYFSVFESSEAAPDARRHWCFRAWSKQEVLAFFASGLRAGGSDNGEPGLRPHYHSDYFAAFLKDPEGNCIEVVYHSGTEAKRIAG